MDQIKQDKDAVLAPEAEAIVNPAAHFLVPWIEEHVIEQPLILPNGVNVVAEMASQCMADAKAEGITPAEIEEEVGDLQEYIAETIAEEHP